MKNINPEKIVIVAGLVLLVVATWFASRAPSAPALPSAGTAPSSTVAAGSTSTTSNDSTATPSAKSTPIGTITQENDYITIVITNPTSSAQWVVGQENTITWSKAAGVTGQMYLVNASTGAIAGWIQQNIAPGQTYFPWNTENLFLSKTNPAGKNVLPGRYVIKMTFTSPDVLSVTSAPFVIAAKPASG